MIVVALVAMGLLLAHRRWRAASWADPAVIHTSVWVTVSICCVLFPELDGYPTWRTIGILLLGLVSFSAGVAAADRVPLMRKGVVSASWPSWLPWLLALLATAGLVAVALRAHHLVPFDGRPEWTLMLRLAVTGQGLSFGWAGYVANLGLAATVVALYVAERRHERIAASLALLAATLTAILLTGRTFIVLLAVLTTATLSIRTKRPAARTQVVIAVLIAVTATILLSTAARQITGLSLGNITTAVYVHLLHYIPAGVIGFDAQIGRDVPAALGVHTFRTVFAVLKAVGFDVPVVDLVRPYVQTPISTNVYSVFSPYYADFGVLGIVVFFLAFGCLTGSVNRQLRQAPSPTLAMLYGILLYALIMQFFQDQYLSLLSQWIQLLIWTAVLTILTRTRSP
jgi:oligosaccharide repeat unit polymerase